MNLINIFLVALGISTDAFAVAFASNYNIQNTTYEILKKGAIFAIGEMILFVVGWLISRKFSTMITSFDHWIAFILLGGIGVHMIYMGIKKEGNNNNSNLSFLTIIGTSIDSAAVGITFAFLEVDIVLSSIIIGITCFGTAVTGILLSSKVKRHLGEYAEVVGGLLLMFIGTFILFEHLAG